MAPLRLICALLLLGSCGPDSAPALPDDAVVLAGCTLLSADFPVEAIGPDGVALRLHEPPARILAGNAAVYDMLCALIEPDRVVGLPLRAPSFSLAWSEGKTLPEARLVDRLDSEAVLGLAPDLAIVHGWQPLEQRVQWRKTGLALVTLPDLASLDDLFETLELLSVLTGSGERFDALRGELETRCLRLAESNPGEGRAALAYVNSGTGGWVAGARTTADVIFSLCGLENAGARGGRSGHVQIEIEELLALDPELIVVSSSEAGDPGVTRRFLEQEPRAQTLRALTQGGLLELPEQLWSSNTQHVVTSAERLAELLPR